MSATATPPPWAERLLRVVLKPDDVDSVSGDLLEEYRDSIHPARGQRRADVWYLARVFGFVLRAARLWAALFGGMFVIRTALDWLAPTADFHTRSSVSTALAAAIPLAAGFRASWRSRTVAAGTVAGGSTAVIGAAVSVAGAVVLLAIWHDAPTLAAIRGSGGLSEVFTLPTTLILPGLVLGTLGGGVGAAIRKR